MTYLEYDISDQILAVGSWEEHNKAELLNTDKNTWHEVSEYPFVTSFKVTFNLTTLMSLSQKTSIMPHSLSFEIQEKLTIFISMQCFTTVVASMFSAGSQCRGSTKRNNSV